MDVLVVGGGIGGLVVARLSALAGHRVVLAERADAPRAVGAGLLLPGAVVDLLERSGVQLSGLGRTLDGLSITTSTGRRRVGVGDRTAFARSELVAALADGLPDLVEMRFGVEVANVRQGEGRAGADLAGQAAGFDLVVGADGIHSAVRAAVDPSVPLRASGQRCWRGIVAGGEGRRATEMWNGRERIGVVPLTGCRTYVYVVRPVDQGAELTGSAGLAAREARALAALQDAAPDARWVHDLDELDRPVWGAGRLVLLGDAAHACTPNLGLGAAMAVRDAVVLVDVLTGSGDPVAAYRRRRALPVRAVQLASRRTGQLAHGRGWVPTTVRRALSLGD